MMSKASTDEEIASVQEFAGQFSLRADGVYEPAPAPKLSRTPGYSPRPNPTPGGDTRAVLAEFGFADTEVNTLFDKQAVAEAAAKARL